MTAVNEVIIYDSPIDASPFLSDLSPKDAPWDLKKAIADKLRDILLSAKDDPRLIKYGVRIEECASFLLFKRLVTIPDGEIIIRLNRAQFCHVRVCPICEWRRSLMHKARFLERIERIEKENPGLRSLFLTLTVPNCTITDLRKTLGEMRLAWKRLLLRPEFGSVKGWIRKTEITKNRADGSAHPHYHCLLLVPSTYFSGREYVKQARWGEVWTDCMRSASPLIVDIRTVKRPEDVKNELLKYVTKTTDLIDPEKPDWTLEYMQQVHHLRFIESGGILKGIFKDEASDKDLIEIENSEEKNEEDLGTRFLFGWKQKEKKYRLSKEFKTGQKKIN